MKKITTVILSLALLFVIFAPQSEASTYYLKNQNLRLPNLYNYTYAKQLKAGSYVYYGVKLGNSKRYMSNMWGAAKSSSVSRGYGSTDGFFDFGNNYQLSVITSYPNTTISLDKTLVEDISISDNYRKYEYYRIKKYFGSTPTYTYKDSDMRSLTYNHVTLYFTKYNGAWYVDEVNYNKL